MSRLDGCVGKVAYANYELAARKVRYRRKRRGRILPYHCTECGLWHLGNTLGEPGRPQPKRRRDEEEEFA